MSLNFEKQFFQTNASVEIAASVRKKYGGNCVHKVKKEPPKRWDQDPSNSLFNCCQLKVHESKLHASSKFSQPTIILVIDSSQLFSCTKYYVGEWCFGVFSDIWRHALDNLV